MTLGACAPKVTPRTYDVPKVVAGPRSTDTQVKFTASAESLEASLDWIGEVSSASFFALSEDLHHFGVLQKDSTLIDASAKIFKTFYETPGTVTSSPLDQSPYIEAAIGETETSVKTEADFYARFLSKEKPLVGLYIKKFGNEYSWPRSATKPSEALSNAIHFLKQLARSLATSDLDPMIADAIRDAINRGELPKLVESQEYLERIESTRSVVQTIQHILNFARTMKVDIAADTMAQVYNGQKVGQAIEAIKREQDALAVLIEIWKMLSPEERKQQFGKVSEDLYEYLLNRNAKELQCLKADDCSSFLIGLAKSWKILPELRKYGVKKLQSELQAAVKSYAENQLTAQIVAFFPEIPKAVLEQVSSEIGKNEKLLKKIAGNYPDFVRTQIKSWSKKQFDKPVYGVETSKVLVDLTGSQFSLKATNEKISETGAAVLGASMARQSLEILKNGKEKLTESRLMLLQQLNKLLIMGGFRTAGGSLFPSFATSAKFSPSASVAQPFYVRNFSQYTELMGVPDQILMKDAYSPLAQKENVSFSLDAQADLLRGMTSVIHLLKDWEETPFDIALGKFKVGDLVDEAPAEVMEMNLFPKDSLFPLAVGNAAMILKNMTNKNSPLALVSDDNSKIWGDQMSSSKIRATMVAIVNLAQGQRQNEVSSRQLARFLLSLAQFKNVLNDIGQTKSSILTEKTGPDASAIDQLVSAKEQIQFLMIGMSNFISRQFVDKNGGVASTVALSDLNLTSKERDLESQIEVIEALLTASEISNIEIYKWTALEIYYNMNKNLWNPALSFYQASDQNKKMPSLPAVVRTLKGLHSIRPHVPAESQKQIDAISELWRATLAKKLKNLATH